MSTKICKDCKHFTPDTRDFSVEPLQTRYARCGMEVSPVDGWPKYECKLQRSYGWLGARLFHACGEEGRWFEVK